MLPTPTKFMKSKVMGCISIRVQTYEPKPKHNRNLISLTESYLHLLTLYIILSLITLSVCLCIFVTVSPYQSLNIWQFIFKSLLLSHQPFSHRFLAYNWALCCSLSEICHHSLSLSECATQSCLRDAKDFQPKPFDVSSVHSSAKMKQMWKYLRIEH